MINALTVDVEDYFHVTAFEGVVDRTAWPGYPRRVVDNTRRILDLFDECGVRGTFFVLGWVAEREPALVGEIVRRGHEVACHGYGHELLFAIGPEAFRRDLRRAKRLLEDQSGEPVVGYRAPSFSITGRSLWAFDVLIEEGFLFDSSVFPIRHDVYGMADSPPHPHRVRREAGSILEFPLSTLAVRVAGRTLRIPVSGGGYLRLFPLWFLRRAIAAVHAREARPVVLYFHPWEIDPGQPRIRAGRKSRFRHYHNLEGTVGKVRALLGAFPFAPMSHAIRGLGAAAP